MSKKAMSLIFLVLISMLTSQLVFAEENISESEDVLTENVEATTQILTESGEAEDDSQAEPMLIAANPESEEEVTVESSEDETEEEVKVMDQKEGAEVRLLQLEKAISRNILAGNEVISQISKNGTDVSELESLITDLEALKLEVQDLDPASENAVESFVNIKKEAIEISQEFRKVAKSLLEEGDRLAIARKIRSMNWTQLREYNDKLKDRVHAQNTIIARKAFSSLGIDNPELLARIEKGNVSIKELREKVHDRLHNMSEEERKASFEKLKESNVQKDLLVRQRMEKAKLVQNERTAKRIEYSKKASEKIQDPVRRERVQKTLDARAKNVDQRIEKNTNRIETIKETRQTIREKNNSRGAQ